MFDFPTSPAVNDTYTAHGVTYRYTGVGWVSVGTTIISASDAAPTSPVDNSLWYETDSAILWLRYNDSNSTQWLQISGPPIPASNLYLPLTGGTLTGGLNIGPPSGNNAILQLSKPSGAVANYLSGLSNGVLRWLVTVGDATSESGSNVGSDFQIQRFADNGAALGTSLTINRASGNATFGGTNTAVTGGLTINASGGWASLSINSTAGNRNAIFGYRGANYRWELDIGDNASESGSNVGSDFSVARFSDAGAFIDYPLKIARNNGSVTLNCAAGQVFLKSGMEMSVTSSQYAVIGRICAGVRSVTEGLWIDGTWMVYDNTNSQTRISLEPGGVCRNQSGTWVALSDEKVKHADSIQPYTRGLADLIQLDPVMFKYNGKGGTSDDDVQHYGLVAQHVQPYIPEVVSSRIWERRAEEGGVIEDPIELLGVDPGRLIYACINAIKELSAEVESLKQKIG